MTARPREAAPSPARPALVQGLEGLLGRPGLAALAARDPVAFPRRFSDPADREVAGWLAAALAFGSVPQFMAVLEAAVSRMGGGPGAFADGFDPARDAAAFKGLVHRWARDSDIAALVYLIGRLRAKRGSAGALFASFYKGEPDIGPALERFVLAALEEDLSPVYGRDRRPRALAQFLARPSKGSACKRLCLYLRWMARPDDGIDLGLWKGVPASALVVPLDTHVHRIARYLGLTRRRSPGWRTALEVTRALRRVDPADPLRFEFAVCHMGISGACPVGRAPEKCAACPLLSACAKGRRLVPGA